MFIDKRELVAMHTGELEAWERLGKVPTGTAAAVAAAATPTPAQVAEREAVTNHDLAAFVDVLGSAAGPDAAAWVHYGLTSSDVLDTATGAQLAESADLLINATASLFETVKRRSR